MQAILICSFIYILLFFPLVFKVYLLLDLKLERLFVCLSFFGINLFGGYFIIDNGKLFLHKGRKAIIVDLGKKLINDNNANIAKIISILSSKGVFTVGIENALIYPSIAFNFIINKISQIVKSKYPYLILSNKLGLVKGKDFICGVEIIGAINGLAFLRIVYVNLYKKVLNGKSK